MSFPIVNGTLIETALDTMSNPIAIPRGFFSGRASATILRKEDALLPDSCALDGSSRLHIDLLGLLDLLSVDLTSFGLCSETVADEEAE